jgi:hypothetical protein
LIKVLEVIVIHDDFIRPPAPKMWVYVEAAQGMFFRINTKGNRIGSVPLPLSLNHFLDHDSHLECNGPLELDDYVI